MDDSIKAIFEKLQDEVTDMHYRWNMYREIYAGDSEQTKLLNDTACNFFYYVQHLTIDQLALSFSKLTDPHKQRSHDNLSLKQVHVYASDANELDLVTKLKPLYEELESNCSKFRALRNKRIGHADLKHAMKTAEEPLPGVSPEYIETALKSLRQYMNTIELHYFNSQTAYEHTNGSFGTGGAALVKALRSKNCASK